MGLNGWLHTSQYNENGGSDGGFDCDKNKWYANVRPKGQPSEHFESISWRKVDAWLTQKRLQFGLK